MKKKYMAEKMNLLNGDNREEESNTMETEEHLLLDNIDQMIDSVTS